MGQKVNPCAYRLACNKRDDKTTSSAWFAAGKDYLQYLHADMATRTALQKLYTKAGISKIEIERPSQNAHVIIHCARPGVIIGKKGVDASFTVRKISNGIGVERIFPLHSPLLSSINVLRRGKVRRAKLNYLKNITGLKAARIEEKR